MSEDPLHDPPKLDYASPPKSAMGAAGVIALIIGTLTGIGIMGFLGLILGDNLTLQTTSASHRYLIAAGFFVVGIVAWAARLRAGRSLAPSRFLFMGLLFGCCITALLEGACFALL